MSIAFTYRNGKCEPGVCCRICQQPIVAAADGVAVYVRAHKKGEGVWYLDQTVHKGNCQAKVMADFRANKHRVCVEELAEYLLRLMRNVGMSGYLVEDEKQGSA